MAKRLSVLIVDDDPVSCDLLTEQIQGLGHTAHCSMCGKEARLIMTEQHFDVVVVSWSLPSMYGHEFVELVRPLSNGAKFVMLTGADQSCISDEARKAVDVVVEKPVTNIKSMGTTAIRPFMEKLPL